jgi:hypothetical protein
MVVETVYVYNTTLKKVGRIIPLKKYALVLYNIGEFIGSFEIVRPEDLKFYRQVSADFVKRAAEQEEIDVSALVEEYFGDAVQQINLKLEKGFDRSVISELSKFFGQVISVRPTFLYFSALLPLVEYEAPLIYKVEVKESPYRVQILPKEKGPGYQLNPFPFVVKSFVNSAKILAYMLFPPKTIFEIVRGLLDGDETVLNDVCDKFGTELKRAFSSIIEHMKPLFERTVAKEEKEELYKQLTLLPDPDTAINEIVDNVKKEFKDKVRIVTQEFIGGPGHLEELLKAFVYDIITDVVENADKYLVFGGHPEYRQEYLIDAILYAITENIREAEDLKDETKKQNIKEHIESALSPYNVSFKEGGFEKFYALVKETLEPVLEETGKSLILIGYEVLSKRFTELSKADPPRYLIEYLTNFYEISSIKE